jgi:hypothetical protein
MRSPLLPPTPLLPYRGKKFFRFHVRVMQSGLDRTIWERSALVPVIASSAVAAIRLVQEEFGPIVNDPTEFECAGPKGGITHRFIGWESLVAWKMFACRPAGKQLELYV